MAGRPNLAAEDLWRMAPACLRHRVVLGYEAIADGVHADDLIRDVLEAHPEPVPED
jgi:MoxR-like ATPase